MTDFIEQDALNDTTWQQPPIEAHTHDEVIKSFVATPVTDRSMIEKALSWLKGAKNPDAPIVYKSANGLRRMLLITSNSYKDRDGETITSKALEEYEASCYPGEGLYQNDNLLLWWHDDAIPMGTIEAVEYIPPFLFESAQEIAGDPISKILWDFAEKNGDNAGTSHRFGYMDKDRDEDGTFHRIFKQETSYLPERSLAANDKTYAGVLGPMTIPESRKRLGKILKEATGLDDFEDLIHTDVATAKKRLSELGLSHKAVVKPVPGLPAVVDEVVVDDEDMIEEDVKDELGEPDGKVDLTRLMLLMNGMLDMFGNMLETQTETENGRMALMKAFDELKEGRVSEKAQDGVKLSTLEEKMKALESRVQEAEKKLALAPRSATREVGPKDPEIAKQQVAEAIDDVQKARANENVKKDSFWGDLKPLPGE